MSLFCSLRDMTDIARPPRFLWQKAGPDAVRVDDEERLRRALRVRLHFLWRWVSEGNALSLIRWTCLLTCTWPSILRRRPMARRPVDGWVLARFPTFANKQLCSTGTHQGQTVKFEYVGLEA